MLLKVRTLCCMNVSNEVQESNIYDEVQHELKDIREPNVIWRVGGTD